MPSFQSNNIELNVQILGDRGPLVFMSHGLVAGSMATWWFQFAPTLAKRYRVVVYDMRGHGRSEKATSGFDIPTMAEDLLGLIKAVQTELNAHNEAVYLIGHSYGALVSLQCALTHELGDQLAGLVLVDAPLPASQYISPSMANLKDPDAVEVMAQRLLVDLGITGNRRQRNFTQHLRYLYLNTSLIDDVANAQDIADEALAQIQTKTLLVYGEQSDCCAAGQRLHRLLPNSQLTFLPCGHFITVEAPDLLNQALAEFMDVDV